MFHSPKRKQGIDNQQVEEQQPDSNSKEKEKKDEEDIENDLNEAEEYELEFDDEKYILKTGYSKKKDAIYLKIKPILNDNENNEDKNTIIFYEGIFSSDDLTKLCKSFRMYDSIEEIYSAFGVIFEEKKAYIKQNNENEKDDNLLYLVIVVGSATGKEDEICLNLNRKEIKIAVKKKTEENNNNNENNNNSANNNLTNQVIQCNCALKEKEINLKIEKIEKELRAENFELKNEIFYLKDDINRYRKTIDANKKEIKNLKTQIKDLKTLLDDKIKNLTDKINNSINTTNNGASNTNINTNINNDNINNKSESNMLKSNSKSHKEIKIFEPKNDNGTKNNETSTNAKKALNKSNKKNNNNQNKNNNKIASIIPAVKAANNLEKKINSKREEYQQLKAAYATKYNPNKEKSSFREFLKQKKNEMAAGKNNTPLDIIESTSDDIIEKKNNKFLKKNKTNIHMNNRFNREISVSQSLDIDNLKCILKEDIEKEKKKEKGKKDEKLLKKEKEIDKEKKNEVDGENDDKDYEEEENLKTHKYQKTDINQKNEDEEDEDEDEDLKEDNDSPRLKTSYDFNRGEKIDQFKFDFDLNVKKLLEDNVSKIKIAEKVNKMNRRIINNVEELQLIENQLLKNYPDTKDIEYNLIYRASEDGDTAEKFHEKCDHISFTLTVIKNTDGNKFGGYTEESWEGENVSKKDFNSFCFSLSKNKIYTVKPDKSAIICDPNLGPSFGSPFFHILDKFFTDGGVCYTKDKCGYNGQDTDFEICNGKEDFDIQEIEIYKVNFN